MCVSQLHSQIVISWNTDYDQKCIDYRNLSKNNCIWHFKKNLHHFSWTGNHAFMNTLKIKVLFLYPALFSALKGTAEQEGLQSV